MSQAMRHVMVGMFCSAGTTIVQSVVVGHTQSRQLTSREVMINVTGCFTYGVGGIVLRLVWPEDPKSLYAARVAWLYAKHTNVAEQLGWARADGSSYQWPSLAQMERQLRSIGIQLPGQKKSRQQRRHRR